MATMEEFKDDGDEGGEGEGPQRRAAPGAAAVTAVVDASLLLADEVMEKLRLLDFEAKYCAVKDVTPFPRTYFALPASNSSVQFQHFVDMVKFLMKLSRRDFTTDKFDDPNTISNKIMLELKDMGFEMDFPAIKLKAACGEQVCRVLLFACDTALQFQGFHYGRPVYHEEETMDKADVNDEAEVADVEEEAVEEEDDEVTFGDAARRREAESEATVPLEATVDPIAWKTELARVTPRLRLNNTVSSRTWRAHFEQAQQHAEILAKLFPDARGALHKISSELSSALERVSSKESYLSSAFSHLSEEYRSVKKRQDEVSTEFQKASLAVSEMTNEFSGVSDQLEELKGQMDSRGSSMTDTSPLMKIKEALASLRTEVKSMELRIGVVGHTLMQSKLKHKPIGHKDNNPATGGGEDSGDFDISGDEASQY